MYTFDNNSSALLPIVIDFQKISYEFLNGAGKYLRTFLPVVLQGEIGKTVRLRSPAVLQASA